MVSSWPTALAAWATWNCARCTNVTASTTCPGEVSPCAARTATATTAKPKPAANSSQPVAPTAPPSTAARVVAHATCSPASWWRRTSSGASPKTLQLFCRSSRSRDVEQLVGEPPGFCHFLVAALTDPHREPLGGDREDGHRREQGQRPPDDAEQDHDPGDPDHDREHHDHLARSLGEKGTVLVQQVELGQVLGVLEVADPRHLVDERRRSAPTGTS